MAFGYTATLIFPVGGLPRLFQQLAMIVR